MKTLVYILSRFKFFVSKYTGEASWAGSYLSLLLFPACFNICSIIVFWSKIKAINIEEFENILIAILLVFSLIYFISVYYFDRKDTYYKMIEKLQQDSYYKTLVGKKNIIDLLLVIHSILWILILIATYNFF